MCINLFNKFGKFKPVIYVFYDKDKVFWSGKLITS